MQTDSTELDELAGAELVYGLFYKYAEVLSKAYGVIGLTYPRLKQLMADMDLMEGVPAGHVDAYVREHVQRADLDGNGIISAPDFVIWLLTEVAALVPIRDAFCAVTAGRSLKWRSSSASAARRRRRGRLSRRREPLGVSDLGLGSLLEGPAVKERYRCTNCGKTHARYRLEDWLKLEEHLRSVGVPHPVRSPAWLRLCGDCDTIRASISHPGSGLTPAKLEAAFAAAASIGGAYLPDDSAGQLGAAAAPRGAATGGRGGGRAPHDHTTRGAAAAAGEAQKPRAPVNRTASTSSAATSSTKYTYDDFTPPDSDLYTSASSSRVPSTAGSSHRREPAPAPQAAASSARASERARSSRELHRDSDDFEADHSVPVEPPVKAAPPSASRRPPPPPQQQQQQHGAARHQAHAAAAQSHQALRQGTAQATAAAAAAVAEDEDMPPPPSAWAKPPPPKPRPSAPHPDNGSGGGPKLAFGRALPKPEPPPPPPAPPPPPPDPANAKEPVKRPQQHPPPAQTKPRREGGAASALKDSARAQTPTRNTSSGGGAGGESGRAAPVRELSAASAASASPRPPSASARLRTPETPEPAALDHLVLGEPTPPAAVVASRYGGSSSRGLGAGGSGGGLAGRGFMAPVSAAEDEEDGSPTRAVERAEASAARLGAGSPPSNQL
eukprot:XP_001696331.1 predicted protein [Chlamydomonas reinhardtii]